MGEGENTRDTISARHRAASRSYSPTSQATCSRLTMRKREGGGYLAVGTVEGHLHTGRTAGVLWRELDHAAHTHRPVPLCLECVAPGALWQGRLASARRLRRARRAVVGGVSVRPVAAAKATLRAGAAEHACHFGRGVGPRAQAPIEGCGVVEHQIHVVYS
eukprot:2833375-Rhodomonas_salina.1